MCGTTAKSVVEVAMRYLLEMVMFDGVRRFDGIANRAQIATAQGIPIGIRALNSSRNVP